MSNEHSMRRWRFRRHWLRGSLTCLTETAIFIGSLRLTCLPHECAPHHLYIWGGIGLALYGIITGLIPNATYRRTARRDEVTACAMKTALAYVVAVAAITAFAGHTPVATVFWVKLFIVMATMLTAERLIVNSCFIRYCSKPSRQEQALLICREEDAPWMQQQLEQNTYGLKVTRLKAPADAEPLFQTSCLTDALEAYLQEHPGTTDLYYSPLAMQNAETESVEHCARRHGIVCHLLPQSVPCLNKPMRLQCRGNICVTVPGIRPLRQPKWRMAKRLTDIVVSLCALLTVFPLFALVAAIFIKRQSRGPILSFKKMCGMNGKTFNSITFRTRHLNAAPSFLSGSEDPGSFPFGRFLAKSKLERLPQLLCVLKGSMTLVGSQTMTPEKLDDYRRQQRQLLASGYRLKAGITSHHLNRQEGGSVQADIWYCRNWGFWLDVRIMLRRLGKLLSQSKADTIDYI